MEEQKSIFRKQSRDSVSSPEQLNDYIRAASPSVWMIMGAVLFLLVGVCVWGIFGHLDTTVTTGAVCERGVLTVFIPEQYESSLTDSMTVAALGQTYGISSVSDTVSQLGSGFDPLVLHDSGLEAGDFCLTASAYTDLPDGTYKVVLTMESVTPMSFIVN